MTTESTDLTIRKPEWIAPAVPLPIRSSEDYVEVANGLKSVKEYQKRVEAVLNPHIERAHATWRGLTEERRQALELPKQWEMECKAGLETWNTEQERLRQAEERRLAELARQAEETRRLEEAAALEREGIAEGDDGKLAEAQALVEEPVETPVVMLARQVPKVEGLSYRTQYSAVLVDILAVCRHVVEHPEHQNLLMLNQTAANQQARSQRENMRVPGLKVQVEKVVTQR